MENKPLRWRDIRRLASRRHVVWACPNNGPASITQDGQVRIDLRAINSSAAWADYLDAQAIDRYCQKYGANTLVDAVLTLAEEDYRPKGTDEVAPQSESPSDSDKHGGDGNSQECDSQSESSSDDASSDEASDSESGLSGSTSADADRSGPSGTTESDAQATEQDGPAEAGSSGSKSTDDKADEETCGMGSAPMAVSPDDDQLERDTPMDARSSRPSAARGLRATSGDDADLSAKTDAEEIEGTSVLDLDPQEASQRAGQTDSSTADESLDSSALEGPVRDSHGSGYGGEHCDALAIIRRASRGRNAAEVAKALRKLLKAMEVGLGIDPSPRIDARKLARGIVARRPSLSRSHREELETPIVILMADVSGSCSAACADTVAACAEVALEMPNCVLVIHSNGEPTRAFSKLPLPAMEKTCRNHYDGQNPWWDELLARHRVGAAVNFGDWDAGKILERLSELTRGNLVWLDSYCARDGIKPASKKIQAPWPVLSHWQGVNNAKTAAIALRMAARRVMNSPM